MRGLTPKNSETSSGVIRKTSCAYDAENRLTSSGNNFDSTGLNQAYDPLGRCVKRTENGVTTYLIHDRDWHLLTEYDASGTQKARYIGGAGVDEMLSRTESTGRVLYYHTDGLGSVTKLTDVNGSIVESYTYDVYGNPSIFDQSGNPKWISPVGNRFLFTGREYLYSLGVYDYRARIYDPYLGRFWQPDPIGHAGDTANIYRYCGNDPVNRTDPSGLDDSIMLPPMVVWGFPELLPISINGSVGGGNGIPNQSSNARPFGFNNIFALAHAITVTQPAFEASRKAEFSTFLVGERYRCFRRLIQ